MTADIAPAVRFEALAAGYGDALLVECATPGGPWRLLVDAGPRASWPVVRERLARLPLSAAGRREIDLAIVSHVDHDHIGAFTDLLADTALDLHFGDIWFNGREHLQWSTTPVTTRSPREGDALAKLLGAPGQPCPGNLAFEGGPVRTTGEGAWVEVPTVAGGPRLSLLSPTPLRLQSLAVEWDRALARSLRGDSEPDALEETTRGGAFPDLQALADRPFKRDPSLPNGSSIAVLLEHLGVRLLLAADAYPNVIGSALRSLAQQRGQALPLPFDLFKLSHHGSRGNLMTPLLNILSADHYLISTDNTRFKHPDDETLARLVLYGGLRPVLCFNHDTASNRRWDDPGMQAQYCYATVFPAPGTAGLRLDFPAFGSVADAGAMTR
ncbi:MAG: hypothetical protein H7Z19_08955 [Chitinophagaceae bacterium]|nr:hypothetical protein [Rubrivivax sp.]